MKRQLFILGPDVCNSLKADEVAETVAAMKELGIYKLPYSSVDVWFPASRLFGWKWENLLRDTNYTNSSLQQDIDNGIYELRDNGQYGPTEGSGITFCFSNISLDHTDYKIHLRIEHGSPAAKYYHPGMTSGVQDYDGRKARDSICNALIVLLATRNAVKTTTRDKLAAIGVGKAKHRHEYVTTISLPRELEPDEEHSAKQSGLAKAPHLRRGHIRRQKYGPAFTLVRQIWIEPVFVNADKEWVESRQRYNVSL